MRDGVWLSGNLYTPKDQRAPAPCLFILTPYTAQNFHERGVYFAAHGLPFLAVDVRGRGNSEGVFRPFVHEAHDGYDLVEWLARQPYCDGKVASWGGSYDGYSQWATAKELPPHLSTLVPAAAVYPGLDFPIFNNISYPYVVQWLTYTSGRTLQVKIHLDTSFWAAMDRQWFEAGAPFSELDRIVGNPLPVFHEWLAHPQRDAYWDAYAPTAEQYRRLQIPILTITGSYDSDQPGALTYYRDHIRNATPEARARHYLIIGPWDHFGTRTPNREFAGVKFGVASLIDLGKLHLQWYAWTMQAGPKPDFLTRNVAYYVMGADEWRYADTLEGVTARTDAYFLAAGGAAGQGLTSGSLHTGAPDNASGADRYVYDPRDTSSASLSGKIDPANPYDQSQIASSDAGHLVYLSAPFKEAMEVSGFFKFSAWLSIDQADTDFEVSIYEITADGATIPLTLDWLRARYREGLREPRLIKNSRPLRYDFEHFSFVSRLIQRGSHLRLVIGPINSPYRQKNYNSAGTVAEESMKDAVAVTVRLYHDRAHPSALYVPVGRPESTGDRTAFPSDSSPHVTRGL